MKLVYLSGPIAGLDHCGASDWRERVKSNLSPHIHGISPMRGKETLIEKGKITSDLLATMRASHPDILNIDSSSITARDRNDVKRCDAMLMNMSQASPEAPSVGSSIELGWANAWDKPVVLVCPMDRSKLETMEWLWDHPIVRELVGWHVEYLDTGIEIINQIFEGEG